MFLSVFDLFKIGIGPSSSHTMGPMVAAARFLEVLRLNEAAPTTQIKVTLHGSLAHTGIGHGTDRAVILGLCGQNPETVDIDRADDLIASVKSGKQVRPQSGQCYRFDPATDLVFDRKNRLPGHANGMTFEPKSGSRLI